MANTGVPEPEPEPEPEPDLELDIDLGLEVDLEAAAASPPAAAVCSSADLWQAGNTKVSMVAALRQGRQQKRDFSVGSGTEHVEALGEAWRWFKEADKDHDGSMDLGEFKQLAAHVDLKLSKRQMKEAFDDMLKAASSRGQQHGASVMFEDFATWFARHQTFVRRDMRRTIKHLFDKFDKDESGILEEGEFGKLMHKVNQNHQLPVVSVTVDADGRMDATAKLAMGTGSDRHLHVRPVAVSAEPTLPRLFGTDEEECDAEQTLREVLEQHGGVVTWVTLRRKRDLRTGNDSSWALVTMESSAGAAAVLKAAAQPEGSSITTPSGEELIVAAWNPKQALSSKGQAWDIYRKHVAGLPPTHLDALQQDPGKKRNSKSEQFDVKLAWKELRKVPLASGAMGEGEGCGVDLAGFEYWWLAKAGISDPGIPVLPESMVQGINTKVTAQRVLRQEPNPNSLTLLRKFSASSLLTPKAQAARRQWKVLNHKLRAMVRMRQQWGALHKIYEAREESLYENQRLPYMIRDPDGPFSRRWDILVVAMTLWTSVMVPLRTCMGQVVTTAAEAVGKLEQSPSPGTFGFVVEACVDTLFIVDLVLNMRTAYVDVNGFREDRPKRIFWHYFKRWFAIDLISCLPLGYVELLLAADDDEQNVMQKNRLVKGFRLLKLAKMLRLGRLRKLALKNGAYIHWQQYLGVAVLLFAIFLLVHLLACFFYLIGDSGEMLGGEDGVYVSGWVAREQLWWPPEYRPPMGTPSRSDQIGIQLWTNETFSPPLNNKILLRDRYVTSVVFVLSAPSHSYTFGEKTFAVFVELVRDVILGLVASALTAIAMTTTSHTSETNLKLAKLKLWMHSKRLPIGLQMAAMEHFNELWTNDGAMEVDDMLAACPPAMAATIADSLYGRFLSSVPLFKGLSPELIVALCMRCKPLIAMKGQPVIKHGQHGTELYLLMSGEAEVTAKLEGGRMVTLGFLGSGAFFGEAALMDHWGGSALRTRTVTATAPSELCFLRKDDVEALYTVYPELKARIQRFQTGGRVLDDKTITKLNLTRDQIVTLAKEFKAQNKEAATIRKDHPHLDDEEFVSNKHYHDHYNTIQKQRANSTVLHAVEKFKSLHADDNPELRAQQDGYSLPETWLAASKVLGQRLHAQEEKVDAINVQMSHMSGQLDAIAAVLLPRAESD